MTLNDQEPIAVRIARCPEHGLHGERDECFECGGPVEQVEMVPARLLEQADSALAGMHEALSRIDAICKLGNWDYAAQQRGRILDIIDSTVLRNLDALLADWGRES